MLIQIDDMIQEIYRRMGSQQEHIDPTYVHVIERAINDSYLQTVLRFRHTEFESDEPYYFNSEVVDGSDGTNAADSSTLTTNAAGIGTIGSRLVDGVLCFDGGGVAYTVTGVSGVGPYTISVAPTIASAHTNADFIIVPRRYEMPYTLNDSIYTGVDPVGDGAKRIFFVYNMSDVTNQSPLRQVDVRFADRGVPLIGQPRYYDRVDNDFYIHPAPYRALSDGSPGVVTIRVRYGKRPEYKSGTDTLDPLPEEWQEVVMQYAFSKILDRENEHDRAMSVKTSAEHLAGQLMIPFFEELDDAEPSWVPVKGLW